MSAEKWKKLEDLTTEIERLDAATRGRFRQVEDQEARQILSRLERKMKRQLAAKSVKPPK